MRETGERVVAPFFRKQASLSPDGAKASLPMSFLDPVPSLFILDPAPIEHQIVADVRTGVTRIADAGQDEVDRDEPDQYERGLCSSALHVSGLLSACVSAQYSGMPLARHRRNPYIEEHLWFMELVSSQRCGRRHKQQPEHTDRPKFPRPNRSELILGIALAIGKIHMRSVSFSSHMDLKPSNVLLDESSVPKIANIGMSSLLCAGEDTHIKLFDIEFSVTPSSKGGTEIKIGSHVIHVPKHLSVHHPLIQMLLFARKRSDDIFACLRSITTKMIFGIAKKFRFSASPNAYKAGCTKLICDAVLVPEYSTRKSFGRRNHLYENESQHYSDPDSCGAEHGIMAVNTMTSASWIVATAAPHHATGNRDLLSGFITEHDDQFVHAVDGVPMKVLARGAVVTDAVVLPDVWFVPGLTANLVSVSQLAELDYSVGFGYGECSIRRASGGKTVGKAHLREGGLYVLDFLKVPLAM